MKNFLQEVRRVDLGQGTIVGALVMGGSFFLLRVGIGGMQGIPVALGLTGMEFATVLQVHIEARRYRERCEARRARCEGAEQKKKAHETSEAEYQTLRSALAEVDQEIRQIEAKIELRQCLNFSVADVAKASAAIAVESYRWQIDLNKGKLQ